MKKLDEKKWEKFDVFGKKGFLRIATTDSSIDSIRLIDGNEKRVPYALWLNLTRLLISTFHAMIVTDEN